MMNMENAVTHRQIDVPIRSLILPEPTNSQWENLDEREAPLISLVESSIEKSIEKSESQLILTSKIMENSSHEIVQSRLSIPLQKMSSDTVHLNTSVQSILNVSSELSAPEQIEQNRSV